MNNYIAQFMVFAAVMMIVLSAEKAFRARNRKKEESPAKDLRPAFFEWFEVPISSFSGVAQPYVNSFFPTYSASIKQALLSSAMDGYMDYGQIVGAQMLAAALGFMIAFMGALVGGAHWFVILLVSIITGFVGCNYPWIWLSKRAEARKLMIAKQLPYALDLLTTAVEAGQDFNAALRYLTRYGLTGPLAEEVSKMLSEIDLGQSRQDALRRLAARINTDESAQFATAVVQSIETGSSLSATLRMQSQDLRRMRFQRAERQAARAPSLMIIPMALFIVPGVFIVVFTPVILRVLQATGKM